MDFFERRGQPLAFKSGSTPVEYQSLRKESEQNQTNTMSEIMWGSQNKAASDWLPKCRRADELKQISLDHVLMADMFFQKPLFVKDIRHSHPMNTQYATLREQDFSFLMTTRATLHM